MTYTKRRLGRRTIQIHRKNIFGNVTRESYVYYTSS